MVPQTVGPDDEKRNEGMKSSLTERKKDQAHAKENIGSISKMWSERATVLNHHPPMHHPLDARYY
jgi:hypothetical protein